ncbi:MAG: hypothetical protein KGH53_01055 [Candidatus Micrarchaeota archaeon]|nr:hypothetical protein [Candidatus Micrarchaeota archaeon]
MGSELKEKGSFTPQQLSKWFDLQNRAREGDGQALVDFERCFTKAQREDLAKGLSFNSAEEYRLHLVTLLQSSEYRRLKSGRGK